MAGEREEKAEMSHHSFRLSGETAGSLEETPPSFACNVLCDKDEVAQESLERHSSAQTLH